MTIRRKFTQTSTPGNVFVPHRERRGTDLPPEKIYSEDLRNKALSENGIGRPKEERYSEGANDPHLGLTNPPPIITPLNHRGQSQMVKVELSEILPYKVEKDEATLRREKLVSELQDGFGKAINRYTKIIINPQKEIVASAIIDSQVYDKKVDAIDLLNRLNQFGEDMGNKAADAYLHYNQDRAVAISAARVRRRKKELAQYGHYLEEPEHEDPLDPGKQPSSITIGDIREAKSISIEDLLSDDTPAIATNYKTEQTKQQQEPDSYAIDPSMLL